MSAGMSQGMITGGLNTRGQNKRMCCANLSDQGANLSNKVCQPVSNSLLNSSERTSVL